MKNENALVITLMKTRLKGDHYVVITNNYNDDEESLPFGTINASELKRLGADIVVAVRKMEEQHAMKYGVRTGKGMRNIKTKLAFNKESCILGTAWPERVYPFGEDEIDAISEAIERG